MHRRLCGFAWAIKGNRIGLTRSNVILLRERGVLGCPFGEMLHLIARVISFSSLFYLASAKICSHTYHQLLVLLLLLLLLLTKPNRRSTSDNNHSYILYGCVFMHFGSVGSLWLLFPLCAVPGNRIALSHFQT